MDHVPTLRCAVVLLVGVCAATGAQPGLVARYTFDEGSGTIARDVSGNGNDGMIHEAVYVPLASGHCLEFNGESSHVDCGNPPALDLHGPLSLEAWVLPTGRARREPGVVGKHFTSYLLTYYVDGQCWWYIGSGGNNARAPVSPGMWHHVAATFDGSELCVYVDGRLADRRASQVPAVPPGGRFLIGAVMGDPSATDPNYTNTSHFLGLIDDVRVYDRALTAEEVGSHAAQERPGLQLSAPWQSVKPAAAVRGQGLRVKVGASGALQLDTDGNAYLIESRYSFPGERISWKELSVAEASSWRLAVGRRSDTVLQVSGRTRLYALQRRIELVPGRVVVTDTLRSLSRAPVGLIVRHDFASRRPFASALAPGGAENPTVFVESDRGALGVVFEDRVSRLRHEPIVGARNNQVSVRIPNMALAPGKSLTLRWSLHPLPVGASYFDFINALRRQWGTNFTLQGPFSWISMTDPILDDPARLKAYLERKRVGVMALVPWLDYDPQSEDHVWPRDQYLRMAKKAIRALKSADPNIRCLGCIETDWVTIYPDKIPGGEILPVAGTGASGGLNAEQTRVIDQANLPWKDSVKRYPDGTLQLELYMRGGKPQTALSVYPALGNYQFRFLMDQIKFLLHEVGMDGFYIDEFSQSWTDGLRSYDGWDGVSAEVSPTTGAIQRTFVDCGLAGVEARLAILRYALRRGKIVVANTYASTTEEQALPVNRFSETQGIFDPMATADGHRPPGLAAMFRSNLASPIGLGIVGRPELHDTARRIMKAVITYLRHGMVYYHYAIEDIPTEGEGSGEYGPINHMFPLTPVELGEGFIIGRERIITCVSRRFSWPRRTAPRVLLFDLTGRQVAHETAMWREGSSWTVDLRLHDWAQIAVIEPIEWRLRLR